MKKFVCRITLLAVLFAALNIVLLFAIPKDKNAYLCAYNQKIRLLETTPQPRMIFIGGSNIAFSMNSKVVEDSLNYHIVNFGLHGGIGIRYPFEDVLQYVRKGDVVVLQFEYGNFYGGNGNRETFSSFMISTDWRKTDLLNTEQWLNIITGIPRTACKTAMRLLKYPIYRSLDTPRTSSSRHIQAASGFNEYGDEVNHFNYPNKKTVPPVGKADEHVDKAFMTWLADAINRYEQAGAVVVVLPPVCIRSCFQNAYNDRIEKALTDIQHPYIVPPSSMMLDDSCAFDFGYHMNQVGCEQNTRNIIRSLYHLKLKY